MLFYVFSSFSVNPIQGCDKKDCWGVTLSGVYPSHAFRVSPLLAKTALEDKSRNSHFLCINPCVGDRGRPVFSHSYWKQVRILNRFLLCEGMLDFYFSHFKWSFLLVWKNTNYFIFSQWSHALNFFTQPFADQLYQAWAAVFFFFLCI